jgi:hypothetical protein
MKHDTDLPPEIALPLKQAQMLREIAAQLAEMNERASERRVAPEQPIMKCRSCEATTDTFEPYASCGRCGAMLVDKVAPEQETQCEACIICAEHFASNAGVYEKCHMHRNPPAYGVPDTPAPVAQDAVSEALDAYDGLDPADSWRGYCREDRALNMKCMTAALRTFSARLRETAREIYCDKMKGEHTHEFVRSLHEAACKLLGEHV